MTKEWNLYLLQVSRYKAFIKDVNVTGGVVTGEI